MRRKQKGSEGAEAPIVPERAPEQGTKPAAAQKQPVEAKMDYQQELWGQYPGASDDQGPLTPRSL